MRADFTCLFEDVDVLGAKRRSRRPAFFDVLVVGLDQLRQTQRAGEPRRPRAHDQDVGLKRFALGVVHLKLEI